MTKALIMASLLALAQLGWAQVSLSAPSQADPPEAVRGAGPRGELHGGRGFAPGGEIHGSRGGVPRGEFREGRGFAPGGEIHERGEGEEHREFEEHERHHERGRFVGPEWEYYPYYQPYYEQPPEFEEAPPPEAPDYLYYCDDPPGYYPNVMQCPGGWEEVPAGEEE